MPFDSGGGEVLARFIMQKNYVRADSSLRATPFMPPQTGRLSVYAISGVDEPEIWAIGNAHVAVPLGKPLHGRADFNSLRVYELGLEVESDPTPHPLHANVIGWDLASTEPRLLALKLAREATFRQAPAT